MSVREARGNIPRDWHYVSLAEAARRLGVDASGLRHAIRDGRLEAFKPAGSRDWFMTESALRAYVVSRGSRSRQPEDSELQDESSFWGEHVRRS